VAVVADAAAAWRAAHPGRPLRALILGVTPELATLPWPADTTLLAVDRSPDMIRAVWPSAGLPAGATAICGDWRSLPLGAGAVDLLAGDGASVVLAYPDELRALSAEARRVLAADGRLVLRAFVQPEAREDLAAVGAALRAGHLGSFHAFKWRLAMALQPSTERGVRLADIWNACGDLCPDRAALAAATGWPLETIATLDAYRGVTATYAFPTLAELRAVLAADFLELACHTPAYELGERCPTLVLAPR
jgi:SAM-dependent methyltransferase